MPDCLILDEPTNGLDPPQIREMRELIQRYAATGRTVLVSSHLLSEVEVTCTHAVVMQSGRVIHYGSVAELLALGAQVHIRVGADPERAADLLRAEPGVRSVTSSPSGDLVVDAASAVRPALVRALVGAAFDVVELSVRSRLEDVFLELVGAQSSGHAVGSGGEG
jgi:ABC-2 type transport system ATP-binding protein